MIHCVVMCRLKQPGKALTEASRLAELRASYNKLIWLNKVNPVTAMLFCAVIRCLMPYRLKQLGAALSEASSLAELRAS